MLILFNSLLCLLLLAQTSATQVDTEDTLDEIKHTLNRMKSILNSQDTARVHECISNDSHENCSNLDREVYDIDSHNNHRHQTTDINDLLLELDKIDTMKNELKAQGATTTLRQVLFIHRHGDRTPIQFPSKDNLANESFWSFHGYGQLTNRGKARLHLLGKLMRARYDQFLTGSVNKNQRISRASGVLRCIESAQVFLSSFLGLNTPDSPDAKRLIWDDRSNRLAQFWQPASIQSVPSDIDGMLAESASCNKLQAEYDLIEDTPLVKKIHNDYVDVKEVLEEVYNFNVDHFYKWFWGSSQVEVERSYFASKMDPRIIAIYDRLQEAGNRALEAYQLTTTSKRLRSGLLINDMVSNMKSFRDSFSTLFKDDDSGKAKKFVHYSAHDMTLVVLLGMLDQWQKFSFRPDYASNIAIELHQDPLDSVWYVKIFYMSRVPELPTELILDRCVAGEAKGRCTLDRFESMMRSYMVSDWQNWMNECHNDLTKVNPYKIGH